MRSKLQLVLPPGWAITTALVLYGMSEGPILFDEWRLGRGIQLQAIRPGTLLLIVACLLQGVYRVLNFHPLFRPRYRMWLETTPWTRNKPLPAGPLQLAWQDGVVLGLLALWGSLQPDMHPLGVLPLFLAGYLAVLGFSFLASGSWVAGYTLAFGLGLALQNWRNVYACSVLTMLMAILAMAALHRSLGRFPWREGEPALKGLRKDFATNPNEPAQMPLVAKVGWPIDCLAPGSAPTQAFPRRHGILLPCLVGWFMYSIGKAIANPNISSHLLTMFHFLLITYVPLGRVVGYVRGYMPPISLWGRICTLRWVIPAYDQVFVAPIVAAFAGMAGPAALRVVPWPPEVTLSISITVSLLLVLNLGPSLRDWRLLAPHRLVATMGADKRNYIKVG